MLAANSLPPLTADANRHRVNRTQPGNSHAALNAAPIADTAPAAVSARGASTGPPSSAHNAANATPIALARAVNRRSHSRAVVCATPTRAAAGRTPTKPEATASSTCPTLSTTSNRPASTNDGNNACDSQQRPHRTRGTKIRQHRPAARTQRRYPDQKHIAAAHRGHSGRGTSTPRPASA